jgi:molybdopterin-guanine dinucleotide biosynthesis protein B
MPPVITFIGWHNSGKTTLTREVVSHLKAKGYRVAVIKSTKETGLDNEQSGTDTARYRQSGADAVALAAPDLLTIKRLPLDMELKALAHFLFPEVDIVIGEGFKKAADVAKIEVRRDPESPCIYQEVEGVIAVASDLPTNGPRRFGLKQSHALAEFIEQLLLSDHSKTAR